MNFRRPSPNSAFQRERDRIRIRTLCAEMGYGYVMQVASDLWAESAHEKGYDGSEFTIGPCALFVVPCGCANASECEWCEGCGWVTKRVKVAKDAAERTNRGRR